MSRMRRSMTGILCLAFFLVVLTRFGHERHTLSSLTDRNKGGWDYDGTIWKGGTSNTKGKVTFVVRVTGELGNHLFNLARGIALAEIARTTFQLDPTIVLRQQTRERRGQNGVIRKGVETQKYLKQCFPWFRSLPFGFGNSDEYSRILSLQNDVLSTMNLSQTFRTITHGLDDDNMDVIWTSMKALVDIVPSMNNVSTQRPRSFPLSLSTTDEDPVVSMPMIDVKAYFPFFPLFQGPIRQAFVFDNERCCNLLPDSDETVFHYRNFLGEMPRRGKTLGYQEMSPYKIAHELFRDSVAGDKVAILTRINDAVVSDIVDKLKKRGLQVRLISGQSAVEDWCFLKHAQKELVGGAMSTFVKWAAFLGNATRTRLYFLDSPMFRKRDGLKGMFDAAKLVIDSDLGSRIRYEVYRSEDIEELIKKGKATRRFELFDQLLALLESKNTTSR